MMKLTTAACALALGIAWAAAPAIAQETTKDKAEKKAEGKTDTVGGKMDRAWDKTKAKTKEMKDNVMGKGDASADVRSAQQALKGKGFNPGPIDGVMGPRTTAAVKEFQQKENLTVSGSLDADTNARLMASTPRAASPASEPAVKKQSQ